MLYGCSQNYGPQLVMDDITAPKIKGTQKGTLILGTTHMSELPKLGKGTLRFRIWGLGFRV